MNKIQEALKEASISIDSVLDDGKILKDLHEGLPADAKSGVIDALDIMSYGKSLAISNGIDNPTNAEIIEAVNKTGSNAQIYVDIGFAGIYSNKTSPDQQQALLDSMPGFKEAWDRFNASVE